MFALPFALQKLSFLLILIQRFIMQNFSDFSDWQTFVVFTRLQIWILTLRILFDVVVLWFSSQTRSFLIFALHLLFSFQDTKGVWRFCLQTVLLLSKQISEERLFVSFSSNLSWRVGPSGLEPPTSRLSGVRSNRLSYGPLSWWRWGESNPWPPACKAGALPAELHPHFLRPCWFSSLSKYLCGTFKIEQCNYECFHCASV